MANDVDDFFSDSPAPSNNGATAVAEAPPATQDHAPTLENQPRRKGLPELFASSEPDPGEKRYSEDQFDWEAGDGVDSRDAPKAEAQPPVNKPAESPAQQQRQQEPAKPPEPPAQQPPTQQQAAPPDPFTQVLHQQAQMLGLDTKVFQNNEQLSAAINAMDQKLAQLGRHVTQRQAPAPVQQPAPQQRAPQAPQRQPAPPQREPAPSSDDEFDQLLAGLDEEVSDPHLIKAVRLLHDRQHQRLAQLESYFAEQQATAQRDAEAAFYDAFDEAFAADADKLGDVIGRGNRFELTDQNAMNVREQVIDEAVIIGRGYAAAGLPIPNPKLLYAKAKSVVLSPHLENIARKQVQDQSRDEQGRWMAKPTHRQDKPLPNGDAKAVAGVAKFYADRGIPVEAKEEEIVDGVDI